MAQPSVIKIGGPSAMLEIAALAKAHRRARGAAQRVFRPRLPGVAARQRAIAPDAPFERLFIDLEAVPLHDLVVAKNGR